MMYKTTNSQHLKLKKGKCVSALLKLLHKSKINLLQISISGMPALEAPLTRSLLYQPVLVVQLGDCRQVLRLPFDL